MQTLGLKNQLKLEINGKRRIRDTNLLPILHQLPKLLRQIRPRLLLQRRRGLEIQRRTFRPERRPLELRVRPLAQAFDEFLQCTFWVYQDGFGEIPADGTIGFLFVFEGVGVDAVVAGVHHVVCEIWVAGCGELEGFVAACGGDDGVCGCDGGDDVFDHALR